MPTAPAAPPLGLLLSGAGRDVSRAFDRVLEAAGGSLPTWQVLMALKRHPQANQKQLAGQVGIQGATLTHHLNAMEAGGLVFRRRDPTNRRVHIVELTPEGDATFHRLREVAATFDRHLRAGLTEAEVAGLRSVLTALRTNLQPLTRSGRPAEPQVDPGTRAVRPEDYFPDRGPS